MNDPASRLTGKTAAAREAQAADLSAGSLPTSSRGSSAPGGVLGDGGISGSPATAGAVSVGGPSVGLGAGGNSAHSSGLSSGGGGLSGIAVGGGAGGESLVTPPRVLTSQDQKQAQTPQPSQESAKPFPATDSSLAQSHLPKAPEVTPSPLPPDPVTKQALGAPQGAVSQGHSGIQSESSKSSSDTREAARIESPSPGYQERTREQERAAVTTQAQVKETIDQRSAERPSDGRSAREEKSIYFAPSKEEQSGTALKGPKLPERVEYSPDTRERATSESNRAVEGVRTPSVQEGERGARTVSASASTMAESATRAESAARPAITQAAETARPATPASPPAEQSHSKATKPEAVNPEATSAARRVEYRPIEREPSGTRVTTSAPTRSQGDPPSGRDRSAQATTRPDATHSQASPRELVSRQGATPVVSRPRNTDSPAPEQPKSLIETIRERLRGFVGTKAETTPSPKESAASKQSKASASQSAGGAREKSKETGASSKQRPVAGKEAAEKGETSDRRAKASAGAAKAQDKANKPPTAGKEPAAKSKEDVRSTNSREAVRPGAEGKEKRAAADKAPIQTAKPEKAQASARAPQQRPREGIQESDRTSGRGREVTRTERAENTSSRSPPRETTREVANPKGIDRLRRAEEPRADLSKERKEALPLAEKVKLGTATPVEKVTHEVVQFVKGLFGLQDAEIPEGQTPAPVRREQEEELINGAAEAELSEDIGDVEPEDLAQEPFEGQQQGEVFSIRGRVVEFATAQPLGGITLEILGHGTCRTDKHGEYYFENLREGFQYTLVASANSYDFTPNNVHGIISGNTTHHFFGRSLG